MGVKSLWTVLSGVGELTDIRQLQGQRVAVDLAGWIVQSKTCQAMTKHVNNPHIRTLFFRAAALQALDIHPIFVLDGSAPEMKREVMKARRSGGKASQSQSQTQTEKVVSMNRKGLKSVQNECLTLIRALGLEHATSQGEAEAMCAQLNAEGYVDAVITEDSDVFCYGAKVVLQNFALNAAVKSLKMYKMDKIEDLLEINRDRLIFMAIVLGCDLFPTGIPTIGKDTVLPLFRLWPKHWNTVNALKLWAEEEFPHEDKKGQLKMTPCEECQDEGGNKHCSDCQQWSKMVSGGDCHCLLLLSAELYKVENIFKKKCAAYDPEWWSDDLPKVLDEFLSVQEIPKIVHTSKPDFDKCVDFLMKKCAWTDDYAAEKVLPFLTRWQTKAVLAGQSESPVIKPIKITKKRVKAGSDLYEVDWKSYAEDVVFLPNSFESTEPAALISSAYPDLVSEFLERTAKPVKPVKPKAASRKKSQPVKSPAKLVLKKMPKISQKSKENDTVVKDKKPSKPNKLNDKEVKITETKTEKTGTKTEKESPVKGDSYENPMMRILNKNKKVSENKSFEQSESKGLKVKSELEPIVPSNFKTLKKSSSTGIIRENIVPNEKKRSLSPGSSCYTPKVPKKHEKVSLVPKREENLSPVPNDNFDCQDLLPFTIKSERNWDLENNLFFSTKNESNNSSDPSSSSDQSYESQSSRDRDLKFRELGYDLSVNEDDMTSSESDSDDVMSSDCSFVVDDFINKSKEKSFED